MKKVAAIICAYNEERTINEVLSSIAQSGVFNEIIVVNDGSTDNTKSIIIDCKDTIPLIDIHQPVNKGKGYAMSVGIEKSSSEVIVFCDAGLSNLSSEHFLQLTKPILENEADMVLGQATKSINTYKVKSIKSFTGVTALLKNDILPILDDMKVIRHDADILVKQYYQFMEKRVKYVLLEGLIHVPHSKTNKGND